MSATMRTISEIVPTGAGGKYSAVITRLSCVHMYSIVRRFVKRETGGSQEFPKLQACLACRCRAD
jgi:hypothetical protein